jgi:hypothetical protein
MRSLLLCLLALSGCAGPEAAAPSTEPASTPAATASRADEPAGWRYERITLPPEFAPDFPFEGYEELLFAPGMFDPDSPSYFTYAFILKLETAQSPSDESVQAMLEAYFRGLIEAVARSKEREIDGSTVTVAVRRDGDVLRGEAGIVDAFVTGAPITLHLQLELSEQAEYRCVIAMASPRPIEDPVWEALRVEARRFQCGAAPLQDA